MPPKSKIVNEPETFYYVHKKKIWLTIFAFMFLVSMVVGQSISLVHGSRMKKKLLDYQHQLKSLASQLAIAEERERRRIATELHDTISQSLVISKVTLEQLRKSETSKNIIEVLDNVCGFLTQSIETSRSLTFDLGSPILYELGFEAAVSELLYEQVQRKYKIQTEFDDDGEFKPLQDDIGSLVFRMIKELLMNIVKHAQAQNVRISIEKAGLYMQICINDDGIGFDPNQKRKFDPTKGGFGLFSIRERLEQIGGKLEIKSSPGKGCQVIILVPLKSDVKEDVKWA